MLWLNKANQEVDSEHVPIMNQLYRFYNRNASSIRGIMIANCPWLENNDDLTDDTQMTTNESNTEFVSITSKEVRRAGNPLSQPKMLQVPTTSTAASLSVDSINLQSNRTTDNSRSIQYLAEFREEFEENHYDVDNSIDDSDLDDDSQGLLFHCFHNRLMFLKIVLF